MLTQKTQFRFTHLRGGPEEHIDKWAEITAPLRPVRVLTKIPMKALKDRSEPGSMSLIEHFAIEFAHGRALPAGAAIQSTAYDLVDLAIGVRWMDSIAVWGTHTPEIGS